MNEVEIKTVDTILDKGVRVPIPAPFFLRWFGVKNIAVTVRRPVMGTLLRISKLYEKMDLPQEPGNKMGDWIKLMTTHSTPVCRMVALGMLRGRLSGWLWCRPLARYLKWHANPRELANLAAMLVTLSGVQDFLNTIKFLGTMKITQPRKASQ